MTEYAKMLIARHDARVAREKNLQSLIEHGIVNAPEQKQENKQESTPEIPPLTMEDYDNFLASALKIA